MHGTCLSNKADLASFPASIIDVEIAKTNASFLAVYQGIYLHNVPYFCD